MTDLMLSKNIGKVVSSSLVLVTLAVTPYWNVDPINVPKFWALTACGFAAIGILIASPRKLLSSENLLSVTSVALFILAMFVSILVNPRPFSQELFGVNGRNTGFISYLSLAAIFLATTIYFKKHSEKIFLVAAIIAFGLNVVYADLQALGLDPQKWINQYSAVIGTLGNPNFASALLAMGLAFAVTYLLNATTSLMFRTISFLYIPLAFFGIIKSDAQQGLIVALIVLGIIGYFFIRSKTTNNLLGIGYLSLGGFLAVIGVLGTLQIGPMTRFLYKESVTYRGDYWNAGVEMFKSHLWFGVGLDSYGDFYRTSRTLEATLRRGPSVISNAAHNVFIDIAANIGIFALFAYLLMICLGFRAAWKFAQKTREFNPFFVGILTAWIGYLVQSAISINNLGLSIWGWILPATLIAMSKLEYEEINTSKFRNKNQRTEFSGMFITAGTLLGLVVGFLPFKADSGFRTAIASGDALNVMKSVKVFPQSSDRINYAGQLFAENQIPSLMQEAAIYGVKFNKLSFDSWNMLYLSTEATVNQKVNALRQMKALDPHNPDLKKLG